MNFTDLSTSPTPVYFIRPLLWVAFSFQMMALGSRMLDSEFRRQRAQTVRELAEKANDPFVKGRLLALLSRYDDSVTARTPVDAN
jgi:hypothetical protein